MTARGESGAAGAGTGLREPDGGAPRNVWGRPGRPGEAAGTSPSLRSCAALERCPEHGFCTWLSPPPAGEPWPSLPASLVTGLVFINADGNACSMGLMEALGKLYKAPTCTEGLFGGLDFRELRLFLQLPPSPWTMQKDASCSPPPTPNRCSLEENRNNNAATTDQQDSHHHNTAAAPGRFLRGRCCAELLQLVPIAPNDPGEGVMFCHSHFTDEEAEV